MARENKRRATYEDLLAVPDHLVAEILDGELIVSPRPASPHAFAGSSIVGDLFGPFSRGPAGPGGWWILFEPELHLHGDVVVPDLAAWRKERMPRVPNQAAFELAPDWVCEILSASTASHDRKRKTRIYAREAVAWRWYVDPLAKSIEVYRLESGAWREVVTLGDETEPVRVPPFDAVALDIARWWLTDEEPLVAR